MVLIISIACVLVLACIISNWGAGEKIKFEQLDARLDSLISRRVSFAVVGLNSVNFSKAIKIIEKQIEKNGLKCRIYSKEREGLFWGLAEFLPVIAFPFAAFIAGHHLLTKNPDFEIIKINGWFGKKIHIKPIVKK